jgi:hypothetical protein
MQKLRIVAVGFLTTLCLATATQETEAQIVKPTKVSVTAPESESLVPGDYLQFQLQFYPAPQHYGGGRITVRFEKVDGPSSDLTTLRVPLSSVAEIPTDLIDDVGSYHLQLSIAEWMSPGKWVLKQVSLGQSDPKLIPFSEDVSFNIPDLRPMVGHIHGPESVEAGHQYDLTVTLDEFPTDIYKDCARSLLVRLDPVSPGQFPISLGRQDIIPGQLSYKFSHLFESDFPSGLWQAEVKSFAHPLHVNPTMNCRYPSLRGDVQIRFEIVPSKSLVTPTSVKVIVNPSQIQLLREEIERLSAKAQRLKKQLSSKDTADNQARLRSIVDDALTELAATEEAYKKEGKVPSYDPVIEEFFDDIRVTYNEALKALTDNSAQAPQSEPRLMYANAIVSGSSPRTDASEAVLKSIERNIHAYQIAISSGALEFDLEVRSDPQDATISYQRAKVGEFKKWRDKTNSTLQGLTRAFYVIKIQKTGYGDQCVEYDGMVDTSPVIVVKLTHEDGCAR